MYIASDGWKTAVVEHDPEPSNPRTDWDNVGKMVCWHGRYRLGDEQPKESPKEYLAALAVEKIDATKIVDYLASGNIHGFTVKVGNRAISVEANLAHGGWGETYGPNSHELVVKDVLDSLKTKEILSLIEQSNQLALLPLYLYDHSGISISTGDFGDHWDSGQVGFIYMDKDTAMENLAIPSDKIRVAQAIEGDVVLVQKAADDCVDNALAAAGFVKVKNLDIQNPDFRENGNLADQPVLSQFCINQEMLYKMGHKLYTFDTVNADGNVVISPVATFNPDLEKLTDDNWKARAVECLKGEVECYDQYLRGEVYGVKMYEGVDEVDACWGYFPSQDKDGTKEMFDEMIGHWAPELVGKFEHEIDGDFDIEEYLDQNDFPERLEVIKAAVADFVKFEDSTADIYPWAKSVEDILADEQVMSHMVWQLYEDHSPLTPDDLMGALNDCVGVNEALIPKISKDDLEDGRVYTAEEVQAIFAAKKPSLDSLIPGAEAMKQTDLSSGDRNGMER